MFNKSFLPGGGGGGVLGLEKGTDCGPSAAELWLLQANNAKKGGCPVIIDDYRKLSYYVYIRILH